MTDQERKEIHELLKKHRCSKEGQLIIEHTMRTGRLNKRALVRDGIKGPEVERMIAKLQRVLRDYEWEVTVELHRFF